VFKVRHIKTKLLRAAKVIKRNSVDDEELLLQETEILKNLDHPNIVRILEIFSDSEHYYIITECLNGGELLDRVKSVTSYNELAVRLYMKQIFSAMVYCHERKVVHRDLKVLIKFNLSLKILYLMGLKLIPI
jgi:calcium-dependent protein kinase